MKSNKPLDKTDKLFASIVDSVCYWLGYQFKIGRDQLIHEASLRYPIADTITARDTSIDKIVLEHLHPYFKSKKIDLVIYEKEFIKSKVDMEGTVNKIEQVYEFKLTKKGTGKEGDDEHQRVFDDVVRLGYFNMLSKADCYFLMCGKLLDFKTYFIGQKENTKSNTADATQKKEFFEIEEWDSKGLYRDWFGFNKGDEKEITFSIEKSDKDKFGLNTFRNNYIPRDEFTNIFDSESMRIKTTCMSISPNSKALLRTHAAGIWKIESV